MSDFKVGNMVEDRIIQEKALGTYGNKKVVDCGRYYISFEDADKKVVKDIQGKEHTVRRIYRHNKINRIDYTWEQGGYIESEKNLDTDQNSTAWIDEYSMAYGWSKVKDNAQITNSSIICNNAIVSNNAYVGGSSIIYNNAKINDSAHVLSSWVGDNAEISEEAYLHNAVHVFDNVKIKGKTHIEGTQEQRTLITGDCEIDIKDDYWKNKIVGLYLNGSNGNKHTNLKSLDSITKENITFTDKEKEIISFINNGIKEQLMEQFDNTVSNNKPIIIRDGKKYVFCNRYFISLDKYDTKEITDIHGKKHTLYRIYRYNPITYKWESGGYIEHERNLDSNLKSTAWIKGYNSMVYDNAVVTDNAEVNELFHTTIICDNAKINGSAKVKDSWVGGNAEISEEAYLYDGVHVFDNVKIKGKTRIECTQEQRTLITGDCEIDIKDDYWKNKIVGLYLNGSNVNKHTNLKSLDSIKKENITFTDKEKEIIYIINKGIEEEETKETDNTVSNGRPIIIRDKKKYVFCNRYFISLDKYDTKEITDIHGKKHTLYRIYRYNPISGEWESGGYIEHERNLDSSPESTAWIDHTSKVYDNTKVSGNAKVSGRSVVCDNANIYGNAKVSNSFVGNNAKIYGSAKVEDSWVGDNAEISDTAHVEKSWIEHNTKVKNKAKLTNGVIASNNSCICDNAVLNGNININDNTIVYSNANLDGSITLNGQSEIGGNVKLNGIMLLKDTEIYDEVKINNKDRQRTEIKNSKIGGNLIFEGIEHINNQTLISTNEATIDSNNTNTNKYIDETKILNSKSKRNNIYTKYSISPTNNTTQITDEEREKLSEEKRKKILNLTYNINESTLDSTQYDLISSIKKIQQNNANIIQTIDNSTRIIIDKKSKDKEYNSNPLITLKEEIIKNTKECSNLLKKCNTGSLSVKMKDVTNLVKHLESMVELDKLSEYSNTLEREGLKEEKEKLNQYIDNIKNELIFLKNACKSIDYYKDANDMKFFDWSKYFEEQEPKIITENKQNKKKKPETITENKQNKKKKPETIRKKNNTFNMFDMFNIFNSNNKLQTLVMMSLFTTGVNPLYLYLFNNIFNNNIFNNMIGAEKELDSEKKRERFQ